MRFDSQFWRMNCQTFSVGLSSGDLGGSGRSVMLAGTLRRLEPCQPAWSSSTTACAPGVTSPAIGELVLLPDAHLVLEPHLYGRAWRQALADLRQPGGKVFLNVASASSSCR